MSVDVVVVGAGMGGLAAAIALAAAGRRVRVYERGAVGGKVGRVVVDGVAIDTGPSVLTLPDVVGRVFARAGIALDDVVTLVRPRPAFRYLFPDAPSLDVFVDVDDTLDSVRDTLGADAADDLAAFLRRARAIWDASKDTFVFAPAPTVPRLLRLALGAPRMLLDVDPLRSMNAAIDAQVRAPALRRLLARYATYNGSDPRRAPATLNCIAHVELDLGGFGVKGGMGALVDALVAVAKDRGVEFVTGDVEGVVDVGGVVKGVRVDGAVVEAGAVVVNADVGWLRRTSSTTLQKALPPPQEPSMSGANAVLRARRDETRVAHTVLFSDDGDVENAELFDARRAPAQPTVYVCAPEKAHATTGWADHEVLFTMVNTPALPRRADANTNANANADAGDDAAVMAAGLARLRSAGLIDVDDAVIWQRGARGLAEAHPGSGGALYGPASNARSAAFRRVANRLRPGLYAASGSAHPGGGVPLCLAAGLLAADALLAEERTG